jgi:hypothetical protein
MEGVKKHFLVWLSLLVVAGSGPTTKELAGAKEFQKQGDCETGIGLYTQASRILSRQSS